MRKVLTSLGAIIAITIGGLITAGTASATPADPVADRGLQLAAELAAGGQSFDQLSDADQKAVVYVTQPVATVLLDETAGRTAIDEAAGANGTEAVTACWTSWKRWGAQAAAGNTLYTWWQGLDWCGNGTSITSYSRYDRGGETSTPGWTYIGPAGATYNNVGWEIRSRTQETFQFSVIGYPIQTPTECGQIRGGAGGLTSSSTSCSL